VGLHVLVCAEGCDCCARHLGLRVLSELYSLCRENWGANWEEVGWGEWCQKFDSGCMDLEQDGW